MHIAGAVLLALWSVNDPAAVQPGSGATRFDRASDAMVKGHHAVAAERLVSLADDLPDDPLADDALFIAGTLFEEKLAKPARAITIYRRLLERYPDSRVTLAAKRRLERLDLVVHSDADARALGAMNEILYADPPMAPERAIAAMEALVARELSWSGLSTAQLWLAEAYARAGRRIAARRTFELVAAAWPDGEEGFEALRQAALLAALDGDFGQAHSLVGRMDASGDPGRGQSVHATQQFVDREQLRDQLYTASFVVMTAAFLALALLMTLAAGGLRGAARAVSRPPTEVWYMLPVAFAILASAATGHEQIAPAVGIILAGGLILVWMCGVILRAADAGQRWLLLLAPLTAAVGAVAVSYIAVHRTRLVDLIVTTVRFGPDL